MAEVQWVRIVQVRSGVGRPRKHRVILKSLGLGRPGYARVLPWTPTIAGMVRKVQHLVEVHPISAEEPAQEKPS